MTDELELEKMMAAYLGDIGLFLFNRSALLHGEFVWTAVEIKVGE